MCVCARVHSWRNATVALNSASNYTVVFEGVRGSTWQGDISLDDIKFIGNCPLPGPSLPPPPPPQLYSGNCNFESCSCCWYNNIWDNLDFYRGQGATATQSTGPQFDHTLSNAFGSYMYLEASSRVAGGNARYISKGMYQVGCSAGFFFTKATIMTCKAAVQHRRHESWTW